MPTKRKPLPRLPARCPLCKRPVVFRLCRLCARPFVSCGCTMGDHDYGITERRARRTWLAEIAAKREDGKGKR